MTLPSAAGNNGNGTSEIIAGTLTVLNSFLPWLSCRRVSGYTEGLTGPRNDPQALACKIYDDRAARVTGVGPVI